MKIEVNKKRAWIALIILIISAIIGNIFDRNLPDKRIVEYNNYDLVYFLIEFLFMVIMVISIVYLILQIIGLQAERKNKKTKELA